MLDAANQRRTMNDMAEQKMTREQVEQYRAGWNRINKFHLQEIRLMSRRVRLQQANLLFQTARSMNLRHSINDPELKALRERWAKAKRRYEKNSSRT